MPQNSETLNGHCVHIKLLLLSMRAEDPWVNIDQEIRRTVCSNNLVYPALGLAGMSLSKKKKEKNEAISGCCCSCTPCRKCTQEEAHESFFFFLPFSPPQRMNKENRNLAQWLFVSRARRATDNKQHIQPFMCALTH